MRPEAGRSEDGRPLEERPLDGRPLEGLPELDPPRPEAVAPREALPPRDEDEDPRDDEPPRDEDGLLELLRPLLGRPPERDDELLPAGMAAPITLGKVTAI